MASATLAPTEIRAVVWKRYREAYTVAAAIIRFGTLIQYVAAALGVLILVASDAIVHSQPWNSLLESLTEFGIGGVVAMLFGGGGWISGMVIMALGQIIKAMVDTAVNTSPLLGNTSKARLQGVKF